MKMAPRYNKRQRRARRPIPVWLPLPRPCLRSLNLPVTHYYIPLSPRVYLPPWVLQPPCFMKPICNCVEEHFCATNNCQDSAECLKIHPLFYPCDAKKYIETLDLEGNIVRDHCANKNDDGISSNSDVNTCVSCRDPSYRSGPSGLKNKRIQNKQPCNASKLIRRYDSFTSLEQRGADIIQNNYAENENLHAAGRTFNSNENGIANECNGTRILSKNNKPESLPTEKVSKMGNINSTALRNDTVTSTKSKRRMSDSTTSVVEDSLEKNIPTPTDTSETLQKVKKPGEFGSVCCDALKGSSIPDCNNSVTKDMHVVTVEKVKNLTSDRIHTIQLPDQISKARKNRNSGCCFSGSEKSGSMTTSMKNHRRSRPIIKFNNLSRSDKMSICGCYSSNKSGKLSFRFHKFSDCTCSSTKLSLEQISKTRNLSKCECSFVKIRHDQKSSTHKITKCECSVTNINQKTSSKTGMASSCSSPSFNISQGVSSKSHGISENRLSLIHIPTDTYSYIKVTNIKSNEFITKKPSWNGIDLKLSRCQCKFPPAYEHLSCSKNLSDSCSCTNNN